MKIVDLLPENENVIVQVAAILVEAFKEHWNTDWQDEESARKEVVIICRKPYQPR